MKRLTDELIVQAFNLDVQLNGGDAFARAADLEVHVAEVIFFTQDVGDEHLLVALLNEAHRDARHGGGDRHARGHEAQRAATGAGHAA